VAEFSVQTLGNELLVRRRAREHLIPFIEYTKGNYEAAAHHHFIAGYLEAVERGDIDRLILSTPPRHGKSEMVTRRFPAWFLGRNPDRFVISASYNSDFATDFGRDVRQIIASPEYKNVFPGTELRPDSRAADRWNTSSGGAYFAAGVGSGITGRGMHLGIVDDPIKDEEEANSATHLEKIWRWYKTAFKTRMMPKAALVVCMTRWAKADLIGRVLEDEMGRWTVVNLPAFAAEDDPLGREVGAPLWPAWYDEQALMEMQGTLTPKEWSALYLGAPMVEGGNIFKSFWWKTFTEAPPFETIIQSWDTAYETNEGNSYSVCTTWGIGADGYYLLHLFRDRLEYPDLKVKVEELANKFRPSVIVVEKRASGMSLIQDLQRTSRYAIEPINVVRDKESRARGVTAICSSGRVLIPELAPWADAWRDEMENFPGAKYDDIVDSTVHALTYLRDNYTFSAVSTSQSRVEMNWDVYGNRGQNRVERDWDPYARRQFH
jgi:predicted phage terminase large subunit-like protein